MPKLASRVVRTFSRAIGAQKLGQPVPESNFVSDPTVPLADIWALWNAILSSSTYENLKDDPDQPRPPVSRFRRGDNVLHVFVWSAISNIVSHRIVEQERVLGNDADLRPQ